MGVTLHTGEMFFLCYGSCSARCRDAVASLVSLLGNSIVDWNWIRALLAIGLIALDKCPGVHPIGIAETLRHISLKVICFITRSGAEEVCGSSQLCAGVQCSIEGAIHSVCDMFNSNNCGLSMVDARNALSIGLPYFGMFEYFGQERQDSFLIPIEVTLH